MADPKQLTLDERRQRAYHEAGHAALIYWRGESLAGRPIVLHGGRFFPQYFHPGRDAEATELDLMVLIAGPLAELLSMGILPKRAIRVSADYAHANSDSSRMRNFVRSLRAGRDHQPYQFEIQERVRAILQREGMWQAIAILAEKLTATEEIAGEVMQQIFADCNVPRRGSETNPADSEPVQLGLAL